ncbi:MAG: ribonuclease III [Clostridia bacterium]|nr:ribonuclease III [Clostridia bacterium]
MVSDPSKMNTTALAYLGDALYESFIRERVLQTGQIHADRLHKSGVKYVCASGQANAMKELLPLFSEEEEALVRRAKNHKSATKPKNVDPLTYKWATAFEALVGYLYLSNQKERLLDLMSKAAEVAELEIHAE